MTKKSVMNGDTDNTDNKQPNMTTQTIDTTLTTDTTAKIVRVQQDKSDRVEYHNRDGWHPELGDLSLSRKDMAQSGLNAIAKFATGSIQGNAKLFTVAPSEKLSFSNGTGRFAYVRDDFVPGVDSPVIDVNGVKVVLNVDAKFVPDVPRSYQRLYIDGPKLYAESWDKPIVAEAGNDGYWFFRCISTILEGNNVSVSIGPDLKNYASDVMDVVNSDNPLEANNTRLYNNRENGRFNKAVNADIGQTVAAIQDGAKAPEPSTDDLTVRLKGGGTISLRKFRKGMFIFPCSESGTEYKGRKLNTDSDIERLAIADELRARHWLVVLKS